MSDPAARDKAAARARLRAVRAALTAGAAPGEDAPGTPIGGQPSAGAQCDALLAGGTRSDAQPGAKSGAQPGAQRDARIGARLDALLARCSPRCIGFYWPLRGEFDARAQIAAWLAQAPARRAALPVIRADGKWLSAQHETGSDLLLPATHESSAQAFAAHESRTQTALPRGPQAQAPASHKPVSPHEAQARAVPPRHGGPQAQEAFSPPGAQTAPPSPPKPKQNAPDAPAECRARAHFARHQGTFQTSQRHKPNAARTRILPVPLEFHRWTPGAPMRAGPHGIAEPAGDERLVPDLLLIPCVGFDAHGYRLGYGGGYYDRTLAAWPGGAKPLTIGLAYEACRLDALPREAHDVPLDAIVTDAGCYPRDGFEQRLAEVNRAQGE